MIGRTHPVVEKIVDEVESTLNAFGFELVQLKYGGPRHHPVLSVYIDKPGGVTVNDCQDVNARLSVLLDILDPIAGNYNLVVSSPGVDRPLTREDDFRRFSGQQAAITYRDADGKRVSVRGTIGGIAEGCIILDTTEETRRIPTEEVERAHLLYQWDDGAGDTK